MVERAAAKRDRLQCGEPVAAAGVSERDGEVVADELAGTAGEDGRWADETCPLVQAPAGRQSSDEAALRKHAVQGRGTTITSGVGEPQTGADFGGEGGRGKGKSRRNRSEKWQFRASGFSEEVQLTPSAVRGSTPH